MFTRAFTQGADQRKHHSFASLAFVGGIHRWPVNSPHKGPVTRKMFPFDDVIMKTALHTQNELHIVHTATILNAWLLICRELLKSRRHNIRDPLEGPLLRARGSPWWRHQIETFGALLAFVRGIHRSPMNSPHKGQWRGALMFSLILARTNDWANHRDAGYLRRHRAHYDVTVMTIIVSIWVLKKIFHESCT